jgi:HSP20 family protein
MKTILIAALGTLSIIPIVHANGPLDEMILHHERGISKAKEVKKKELNKEVDRLLNEVIANQERELKRMEEIQRKLFPGTKDERADASRIENFADELRNMEKSIQQMFSDFRVRIDRSKLTVTPKIEVREDNKSYDIKAEVPGLARDDIKVKVVNNELQIHGSREEEVKREEKGLTTSEFRYGEFNRTIPLGEKVDPSSMKVEYKDGIITVHLNKLRGGGKV